MVPIRSHVICFEPLAALAQWLVPPASSELCQHVAAPNVGAMHIVLEGLSPSGKSSGFLDLHLAYFCLGTILRSRNVDNVDLLMLAHLRQRAHKFRCVPGRHWHWRWNPSGTAPSRFLWSKIWVVHSQNPHGLSSFSLQDGAPQL